MCRNDLLNLKIADLTLSFISKSEHLALDSEGAVKYFISPIHCQKKSDYHINYKEVCEIIIPDGEPEFVGEPEFNDELNYNWSVYNKNNKISIFVEFSDHPSIYSVCASFILEDSEIDVDVKLIDGISHPVVIDPLIHPLGSLLLMYLVHRKRGLLMHASAVIYDENVYVFTGISGIGKSTMARLWQESGVQVLNDDRLILRLVDDEVSVYTNPMPYYKQKPIKGSLKKIFLLKQSPKNYIIPVKGVTAFSRVLGNFIQQFYNVDLVKTHLGIVEKVIKQTEVFELGFVPDGNIVEMIKNHKSG